MFIDKPITASVDDAVKLAGKLRSHNIRFTGGSSCVHAPELCDLKEAFGSGEGVLSGYVSAPINLCNPYGDFWFYSQHLVQMMVTVFGYDVEEVSAIRCDKELGIIAKYPTFPVTGSYTSEGWYYFVNAYGGKGKLTGEGQFGPAFEIEFNDLCDLLHGAPMKETYDEFIRPVFILNAINRAMESGKTEKVNVVPVS